MMAWIVSLFVLGVLVLVHELGHFIVARWSGVTVERFAIGFGPKIIGWTAGGTEYCLRLFPLGGYVKMAGEQPGEQTHRPDEFVSKPVGVRARIIAAGPLVNYATSVLTLWAVLVIGYPELLPTVGRLVDDMPAKLAGLQAGDRIRAIDGKSVRTWDELTRLIHQAPDRLLVLRVSRDGAQLDVPVTPKPQQITDPFGRRRGVGLVGIAPSGAFETYRLSPLEAVGETFAKQREWTAQIALSLWALIQGRISFKESFTGPIGIVYMTAEASRMGIGPLLYLVSVLSLSLALFNFFPMPILDGGHLMYLAIEKWRGTPVSVRVQEIAAKVSFMALLVLLAMVCVSDLSRFGIFQKIVGLWHPE